ncbi:MAG: nucleotide exchange factor GrpE [Bacteroidota bacterium]
MSKNEENQTLKDQAEDLDQSAEGKNENDTELLADQQKKIREQQDEIEALQEEIQQVKETQLRKAAEMENMRKRLERERALTFENARRSAVESFLPVNDDLLRTLKAMEEGGADSTYVDGIQMVANKFEDVLQKYGVERIDEEGVPFDVDLHDAMLRQKPEDDSVESGTVLQVLENGYKIGDRTIRHAKVIVSE